MTTIKGLLLVLSLATLSLTGPVHATKPAYPQDRSAAVAVRPSVQVGFVAHPHLNAALTEGLAGRGVQTLAAAVIIPGRAPMLLVDGHLEEMRDTAGQATCSARYSIGSASGTVSPDSLRTVAIAALPRQPGLSRPELVERAEEACVDALGAQIAGHVASVAAPASL